MPGKTIKINPQGMVVDADCRVRAKKSMSDTVTWQALGTADCTVVFLSASPFSAGTYVVPAGGTVNSGPINAGAPIQKFRYEVQMGGTLTDDPDIIIES